MANAIQPKGPINCHSRVNHLMFSIQVVKIHEWFTIPLSCTIQIYAFVIVYERDRLPTSSYIIATQYWCLIALLDSWDDFHTMANLVRIIYSWYTIPLLFTHPSQARPTKTTMRQHSRLLPHIFPINSTIYSYLIQLS